MNPSPAARSNALPNMTRRAAEAELSRVEIRDVHGATGIGQVTSDRATAVKAFRGLAQTALKVLGPTDLLLLARSIAISVADRLGTSPSWIGGDEPGASAQPSEINAVPDEGIDPWATIAWQFFEQEREAWERSGKARGFTLSLSRLLEVVGAPSGKARRRADANRLCRLLRARGLVYKRTRVYTDTGDPIYVGNTATQLKEYHFRFP